MSEPLTYKNWTLDLDAKFGDQHCPVWRHPCGLMVDAFLVHEARFGFELLDLELKHYQEAMRADGPE
jgi:hypothetical protein